MFGHYTRLGVFEEMASLLVAPPCRLGDHQHLSSVEFSRAGVAEYAFPVDSNIDFGYTTPLITMPFDEEVRIDSVARAVSSVEPFPRL